MRLAALRPVALGHGGAGRATSRARAFDQVPVGLRCSALGVDGATAARRDDCSRSSGVCCMMGGNQLLSDRAN